MPKLSVIVPIYKVEKYLKKCITSIIEQTYEDIEIILVDDGSPDKCPLICDYFCELDNRVKVIHKQNGGLVSARKAGINIATGEYVTYVDGDDWIEKDAYEILLKKICNNDCDILISGFYYDKGEELTEYTNAVDVGYYTHEEMERYIYPQMLSTNVFYEPAIAPAVWNKIYKREILYDIQNSVCDDITMGEDVAVTYQYLLKAKSCCITDDFFYHYRQNMESMIHTYDYNYIFRLNKLLDNISPYLEVESYQLCTQYHDYMCSMILYGVYNELSIRHLFTRGNAPAKIKQKFIENGMTDRLKNVSFKRLPFFEGLILRFLRRKCFLCARLCLYTKTICNIF